VTQVVQSRVVQRVYTEGMLLRAVREDHVERKGRHRVPSHHPFAVAVRDHERTEDQNAGADKAESAEAHCLYYWPTESTCKKREVTAGEADHCRGELP
jgi:hypothetical protein